MRRNACTLLLAAAACAGLESARGAGAGEPFFTIEGEVREAETNRLFPAARVEIVGASRVSGKLVTDGLGRFSATVFVPVHPVAPEVARERPEAGAAVVILRVTAGNLCSDAKRITLRQDMDPLTVFVSPCG